MTIGNNNAVEFRNEEQEPRAVFPEYSLWAAVLLATVEDLKDIHTKAAAEAWFNSTSQEVGTFLWICEALGLDANAVRRSVN
jgi:hypothetical protein